MTRDDAAVLIANMLEGNANWRCLHDSHDRKLLTADILDALFPAGEKVQIACTPPLMDSPSMRTFIESAVYGYDSLEWREEVDNHGSPIGRLYGVKRQ